MSEFYSPCRCGEFAAKDSRQRMETVEGVMFRRRELRKQTVCANCGRHEPKR